MIVRRFHLLPLFIAALWLPFQAIAAVAMPFCRHGEARGQAMTEQVEAEHCSLHDRQTGTLGDQASSCDHCDFCHLAATGFMPTPERAAAVVALARDFQADVSAALTSAVPEPPQYPPKRMAR